ncbi:MULTISPECIES: ArsR/SmtB family transcription factor [Gluconobacter]|uniref:ArsR family transcriptional regulator n=1 Tax=Gluconobacter albidus TaxID=318683 RepID=A0A149THP4_9PROT|nr:MULTISPECIES: helix-turn-helix domain-containing protein [Gluconobacter]AQS91192.1 transcriptional regulator [Gluconobacter albidus]KXV47399.1 ArsR family transcriptional regulator [Gluconobacter albidus]MBS1026857.1 helix-turn-helix transcriptional regulator [Gluconobacter albidus]OUI84284.1 ArsR family transcriptional regulator [Gluconobacter sp. DsW_056]
MAAYDHPDPATFELILVLRALADPARLDIVRHLGRVGEANCATLIGTRPKSSMSHHFQVLRESGVLRTRIEGVQHRNSLRLAELDARFPGLMTAILNAA